MMEELRQELKQIIDYNEVSKEAIDFVYQLRYLEEQGFEEKEIRRELKKLGFFIDDYGVLRPLIVVEEK